MNILIPHQWLLEHLETEASIADIQKYLSLSGPSVETVQEKNGDQVYDIEITTNRVDSMSVRGIAREAAVILNRAGIKSSLKPLKLLEKVKPEKNQEKPLPKIKNDPRLCNRVLAAVLANTQPHPTPKWMADRLQQIDVQVHNSIIDITNYITHDLGHPCHAFDYDKIMAQGGEIIITEAQAGEEFITLDDEKYETVGGEIVFKNPEGKIIDLPAVMGTKNTSVAADTQNVMLWIENLDAKKVRFASMTHAIRTVAAQLNEKNVDPYLGKQVMLKGIQLYQKLTDAQIASELYDEFPNQQDLNPVKISHKRISEYLGLEIPINEIKQILQDLGCQVETKDSIITVQPPSFRPDIQIPADVVEEIARIYGYHNLPSTLMASRIPTQKPADADFTLENQLKHFLANIGWQEIYSYSAVSQEIALQSGCQLDEHLKMANPLTEDQTYLRRSLIPSLEQAIAQNPQTEQLSVFELASTYQPVNNNLPVQDLKIGLVSTQDYRTVRGEIEALLKQFYIPELQIQDLATNHPSKLVTQQAELNVVSREGGEAVKLGQIYILNNGHIAAELDYQTLLKLARKYPYYQPAIKTSKLVEDMTFTLPENTAVGKVIRALADVHDWITHVELKDYYQQNYTFTLSYQDPSQNLSKEDLQPVRGQIEKMVKDKFAGELVGEV